MVRISRRSREHEDLTLGGSPRATLMMFQASQATAFLDGREYVLPDDVQYVAPRVLRHRLVPARTAKLGPAGIDAIIAEILQDIRVPV
jgi:MoxR-like ATPase